MRAEPGAVPCPRCGYRFQGGSCPLCAGAWECWELQFAPLPLPGTWEQTVAWLAQLPAPIALELCGETAGLRVRLYAPPGRARGAVGAWAAAFRQHSRWQELEGGPGLGGEPGKLYALHTESRLPRLVAAKDQPAGLTLGDPFLALAGQLVARRAALRVWVLGRESRLQERLRALSAYNYGAESGVEADQAPNPWGLRLALLRSGAKLGGLITALAGGALSAGLLPRPAGALAVAAGGALFLAAFLGLLDWLDLRSLPKETLLAASQGALLSVSFSLRSAGPADLELLSGRSRWRELPEEWPGVRACACPLMARDLAALLAPPQAGEGSGIIDGLARQEVPAPPPSRTLVEAPFRIGTAVASAEPVGIDPDGHGLVVGGSRSGKSSLAFALLRQFLERGDEAPGLFLVDPHLSLADSFLSAVDGLPEPQRSAAVARLRVLDPDQPELIPLNLLAVPDFAWAGNAIVQVGRRLWEDYWGPRMQAALLGLFRLAHVWNRHHPGARLGLLHVVFAAFNTDWRRNALAYLPPVERMNSLALDALLGQFSRGYGRWDQGWVTEVISPVLSKVMALELSPWLFAAMHQERFVDLEAWVRERAWIVLRLPAGEMGREGSRLAAGVVYNVFEAVFRRATLVQPIPFYFIIDEAQEVGSGMRLEALLSEGGKFGARLFVLAQSLSLLRRMEGFEPVVQALLANTSTQAFFSPDPEDADLVRGVLSSTVRYGPTTLDLPTRQAWLRARLGGRWQPPALIEVQPLSPGDPGRVQSLIREVIAAHPQDYAPADGWQEQTVAALSELVPFAYQQMLSELFAPTDGGRGGEQQAPPEMPDRRRLGF
ncbi:MAG: type IV secretory system conjugative DNA transfer family protein [Anaerolineales bacterium]|jgi:hypothetical protein